MTSGEFNGLLNPEQQAVLRENTALVRQRGMLEAYLELTRRRFTLFDTMSGFSNKSYAATSRAVADGIRKAEAADDPFAFSAMGDGDSRVLGLMKVDPSCGSMVPQSAITIGEVRGVELAVEERPLSGFTHEHAKLAVARLAVQCAVGLTIYGTLP